MPWTVLGERLILSDKCYEIEQLQDTSNEERLRAVVECWFDTGEAIGRKPSWRWIILALDRAHQTRVSDTIRHFGEPVLGKSCDSISVSTLFLVHVVYKSLLFLISSTPTITLSTYY